MKIQIQPKQIEVGRVTPCAPLVIITMITTRRNIFVASALAGALLFTTNALFAQDAASDEKAAAAELAKKLSNPIASLISVPI